ncbi:hypothetical protein BU15DRAFT_79642 [Melanogaster broomeanus]|nr:hypothetical protein BU15DRAFT_79642 [Melanogaster broomeanus]
MALSLRQGAQATVAQSPPQPLEPTLLDEDPSPSISLLLSTSDSTNSEQLPEAMKCGNKRKNYRCRHFARTRGWCPAGERCGFNHDLSVIQSSATTQEREKALKFDHDAYSEEGRTISGGVFVGVSPPLQNINQEYSKYPPSFQYIDAEGTKLYPEYSASHSYWPYHSWQLYPAYYVPSYPVPVTATIHIPATTEGSSRLPAGAFQINGTTYFSPPVAHAPPPPPAVTTHPIPVPYGQPYPYYPPPPTNCHAAYGPSVDLWYQTSFDPFASDAEIPGKLPLVSTQDVVTIVVPPINTLHHFHEYRRSASAHQTPKAERRTSTQEHEFPYRPPKNQQMGHARRVSVNIKKQSSPE